MKVINKKMCVVFVLVLLEISSLFLMYKSNSNKEIKLDNVDNKEVINNELAIMIEQTNGNYSQYTSSTTWPTGYVFDANKSGCIDKDGNKINKSLSFDSSSNKIIVKTNKTSNCYAYFSNSNLGSVCSIYDNIAECLRSESNIISKVSNLYKTNLTGDGYRYYGTGSQTNADVGPANYVCFGTQSKSKCISDTDKYMYRIIGMFQEENGNGTINTNSAYHLKLIKKEALNVSYAYHNNGAIDIKWVQSTLYDGLNGSYFLNNSNYSYLQDSYWVNKITYWNYVSANTKSEEIANSLDYYFATSNNVYLDELNRTGKPINSQTTYEYPMGFISLMYVSDYLLSLGSESLNYDSQNNASSLVNSWMFIKNNDNATLSTSGNDAPNINTINGEFTMTLFGKGDSSNNYRAWNIDLHNAGTANVAVIAWKELIRPTFYLRTDTKIIGGSGKSTDPYILG